MKLGYVHIPIPIETALYILKQKDFMPIGKGWPASFPAVINHTSTSKAKSHPDFLSAKKGDFHAALRLVNSLVKSEKIKEIAKLYPSAHIIYNHRMKGEGINMIPAAYASKFADEGMKVEHDVIGITNVSHTGASDIARIAKRMRYEGEVEKGRDYILLDDFITSGAEIRDLKDYVESQGGNVVLISTLGHGSYSKLSDIRVDEKYEEKLLKLGITDEVLRKYGIASSIQCLTLGEAAKLSRVVNACAKRQAAQGSTRVPAPERGNSLTGEKIGEERSLRVSSPLSSSDEKRQAETPVQAHFRR